MCQLFKDMKLDKIMGMDESNAKTMNGLWFMNPALTGVWFGGFQPVNIASVCPGM
jgi:hypothetical protein